MLSVAGPAWVGRGAALISAERIDVEPNVCVSQYAVICTGSHDRTAVDFRHDNRPVRLRSGCWVCIGAVVLPGVTVEANAVVSAGAVASRDVLARSVLR
jgi:putative colanic acid biosynthesis acetyltransferase WcaF